jgi:hypothetical protein
MRFVIEQVGVDDDLPESALRWVPWAAETLSKYGSLRVGPLAEELPEPLPLGVGIPLVELAHRYADEKDVTFSRNAVESVRRASHGLERKGLVYTFTWWAPTRPRTKAGGHQARKMLLVGRPGSRGLLPAEHYRPQRPTPPYWEPRPHVPGKCDRCGEGLSFAEIDILVNQCGPCYLEGISARRDASRKKWRDAPIGVGPSASRGIQAAWEEYWAAAKWWEEAEERWDARFDEQERARAGNTGVLLSDAEREALRDSDF